MKSNNQGDHPRPGLGATVLALGGASWPRLGSDGAWVETLRRHGTALVPLKAAKMGLLVASTAGGVSFDAVDENFMLRHLAAVFVAGEMLDWEAPTGGYLLQAAFATGAAAARGASAWLEAQVRPD